MTDAADGDEPPPPPPRRRLLTPERLMELTVVVFGVLIALGLENVVQEVRWHGEAQELEQLFKDDIAFNLRIATERRAVDGCLRQQLQLLSTRASEARGAFPATAYKASLDNPTAPATAAAYWAPLRTWRTASFERALGTEAVKRIPRERFLDYAALFGFFGQMSDLQNEEYAAAADLSPLAFDEPDFNSEVRAEALRAIAAVDGLRGRLALVSVQSIRNAQDFGVAPDRAVLERGRLGAGADRRSLRQTLEAQRQGRGECVDVEGSLRLLNVPG
jgi:hypothetical protein